MGAILCRWRDVFDPCRRTDQPWRHFELMAKRARGATRPGQRAPLHRSPAARRPVAVPPLTSPPAPPRPATLTPEEEARAAEIEARLVAAERSAEEATRRQVRGRRTAERETPVRTGSIAMRASEEYAYVMRDIRRIALIGGSLIALLIGLWAVLETTGIGPFAA
jgi:hypothetical protein